MFIDTHTHFDMCLDYNKNAAIDTLIKDLDDNNIDHVVQISTDANNLEWSYNLAKNNEKIQYTLGIHPSSKATEKELTQLDQFVKSRFDNNDQDKLFGIGETGLDFYRMRQPKNLQIKSFEFQVELAIKYDLPLVVHTRDAFPDSLNILSKKRPENGIMHCFSGGKAEAKKVLDLGFYISFAGNLTYKKAQILHESASYVPLDRLLLETDAPFLTPVPFRGKTNKCEYIIHTYKFISDLRKEPLSKIENAILKNFTDLNKR